MLINYIKTQLFSEENLAVDINNRNCSLQGAAATYRIHFATLQYRLNQFRKKNLSCKQNDPGSPSDSVDNPGRH